MKNSKTIYTLIIAFICLLGCKSKDPVEIIPEKEDPKGNFINGTAFNIESSEVYNANDSFIITIKSSAGSIIKFNLFEASEPNEYTLGKNNKNSAYFLKDSLSPLYSSIGTDKEMLFKLLNINKTDSELRFIFEGNLLNSETSETISIKMNSGDTNTFTKRETASEPYIYYCYSGEFGSFNSDEKVAVPITGNILKFVFDITIKERVTVYIPKNINSGTYNLSEGKEISALIETKNYTNRVYHSTEGIIQIHHDKINRRISLKTEDTYSAIFIDDNSPKTLASVVMNAMY